MHRPGIARISGNTIVLDGTTIEEVDKYHRRTLLLAIDKANKVESEFEKERLMEENRQAEAEMNHKKKISEAAKKIKFD